VVGHPSEKYESQWEGLSHILWKLKNVPNHQPGTIFRVYVFLLEARCGEPTDGGFSTSNS
jgi:prolipoprotein diacylglyceryltransferase